MAIAHSSSTVEERLKKENDTLRKHIRIMVAEIERLRRKLEMTWGDS